MRNTGVPSATRNLTHPTRLTPHSKFTGPFTQLHLPGIDYVSVSGDATERKKTGSLLLKEFTIKQPSSPIVTNEKFQPPRVIKERQTMSLEHTPKKFQLFRDVRGSSVKKRYLKPEG